MTSTLQSLSDKLAALDLSSAEVAALDRLLARAERAGAVEVDLVAPADLIRPEVQRAVIVRTAAALGVSHQDGADAFADALTLLRVTSTAGAPLCAPSLKVDEAWHQFILFTRDYVRYGELTAGRYLHHAPTIEGEDGHDAVLGAAETYRYITGLGHHLHEAMWADPTLDEVIDRIDRPRR
jgi:hypothetical protein